MFYTEAEIDRMAEKRSDPEFIAARLSDPDTVLLPVWRGQNLIDESGDTPRAGGFSVAEGGMLLEEGGGTVFLGDAGGRAYFAIDVMRRPWMISVMLPAVAGMLLLSAFVAPAILTRTGLRNGTAAALAIAAVLLLWWCCGDRCSDRCACMMRWCWLGGGGAVGVTGLIFRCCCCGVDGACRRTRYVSVCRRGLWLLVLSLL